MTEAVPEFLTDIAGQRIEVGDYVVYPQLSGRCVQMVLGRLVGLGASTARIQKRDGGRWSPGWKRRRHRDTRTGRYIDPGRSEKHWAVPNRVECRHKQTGVLIPGEEYDRLPWYEKAKYQTTYIRGTLKDYVEEVIEEPPPVTILITENLVKVPDPRLVGVEGNEEENNASTVE